MELIMAKDKNERKAQTLDAAAKAFKKYCATNRLSGTPEELALWVEKVKNFPTVVPLGANKGAEKLNQAAQRILAGIAKGGTVFARACDIFVAQVVAMNKAHISLALLIDTAKQSGEWPVRDGKPIGHKAGCKVAMQLKSFAANFLNRIELDAAKVPKMKNGKPELKPAFCWNGNSIKQSGVKTGARDEKPVETTVAATVTADSGLVPVNTDSELVPVNTVLACIAQLRSEYGTHPLTLNFVSFSDVFDVLELAIRESK
jgi:hypothetical protein